MRILRNYVLKETAGPFFIALLAFVFILLIGNLIQASDKIITKGTNIIEILKFFACKIPYLLRYALPMSLLTAILLTFGRLSSDNEIIAMRASGFSLYRIIFPLIAIGLILSLLSVILNDKVIPKSHFASRKILTRIAVKTPLSVIEEGTFIRFKNHILFVDRVKKNKLEGIKVFQTQEGKIPRITVAKEGRFIPVKDKDFIKLELKDGNLSEPKEENPNEFYQLEFETYYIKLNLRKGQAKTIQKKPKDMTIGEVKKEIKNLQRFNIDPINLITEIHKRISLSFANLAFLLIGLPLAIKTKKSSKSAGFGLSLVIIITYYVLLAGGSALAVKHIVSPALGAWLPNIITISLGAYLTYKIVED